ncbi:competence damage-inducible protein A [Gottschalkia purinilytica]|uniref:Putative competence-damage inducible protein n=1 Tax=Gottschalkia purinilytica TaxID=1503 RepID=A0A0L0WBR2_GOTPU|nr:competence/damage-inducible protein A [Gottschalkia purinilytica]KNF08882.1 competence damage-inducible protein A [Gottschalkia purinilytica]
MKAEIISVGTELSSGDTLNTNSKYISNKLMELGISVNRHITVSDDKDILRETILNSIENSDILICTGGLGPTHDDITKEMFGEVLKKELVFDENIFNNIESYFKKRNICMAENNKKQAFILEESKPLKNEIGTAPGLYIEYINKKIILLPGPPNEMERMFENQVIPILEYLSPDKITSTTLRIIGIVEATVENLIEDVIKSYKDYLEIATYAKDGIVDIKVTSKNKNRDYSNKYIEEATKKITDILKDDIYTFDERSIEEVVFDMLVNKNLKIGFCESCTGGLISSRLTKVSGASKVLERSIITYSNNSKIQELCVNEETISSFGAVSKETAKEMARGLLKKCESIDIAISVTGIAGPTGGTKEKPVGLVYICLAHKDDYIVKENFLIGDRQSIQNKSSNIAFNLLRKYLLNLI